MLEILGSGLATAVVAVLVFGALGLAVRKMIRDKRAGRGSCSCGGCSGGCAGCSGGCGKSGPNA